MKRIAAVLLMILDFVVASVLPSGAQVLPVLPPPPPPGLPSLPPAPVPGSLIVNMTAPASGSTVSGPITVSASTTVVGNLVVAGVQFQLDGAKLGGEVTSAPYAITWDTRGVPNGGHTLLAVARDAAGLRYTSDSVGVMVSNAPPPPTVTITSPTSGTTVSGTITVSARASSGVGIAAVQFFLDGAFGAEVTTAPFAVPWDTTRTPDGAHTLTAVARDTQGTTATSAAVMVTVANGAAGGPPTVTITAPTAGATVSGTIAVSATATSNVGIAGVQFQLDGVGLGAEVTTAPYTISWDTTTSANGAHTLTAVARDTKNATTTSAPVSITVSNKPTPPPETVKRYEETDPAVAYTAGWTQGNTDRAWSGGTAAVSATAGAQATFTFTGTSVSWIGFRAPITGIARVFLDGVMTEVDTYSPTEEVRAVIFSARGLANATHALTIEVTGQKNPAATAAYIVVDAFDAPAPVVIRVQETDPAVVFTTGWEQGNRDRAWSGGTAAVSTTAGSQATLTFTGTGVSWIGLRGPQTGIARVSIDGVLVAEVDTYAVTEAVQAEVFKTTGLSAGTHKLTIEVTGLKNTAATAPYIVIDAFEVMQ